MTTKRQVFYSFHYERDNWRAAMVRSIGTIEGNEPATDNNWEAVAKAGDNEIEKWINGQMKYRTCAIVLVGTSTANRKWINYEICEAWKNGMGVVGIYIHGLKNQAEQTSQPGRNPFDYIVYTATGKKLSSIVKCYNPDGTSSQAKYAWISKHLSNAVEEAIKIRERHKRIPPNKHAKKIRIL